MSDSNDKICPLRMNAAETNNYISTEDTLVHLCKCLKDKCAWYDKETYDKPMCVILAMK